MSEKVTGKDLKQLRQPDQFQAGGSRVVEVLVARQRQILIGVGLILGVLLLAWVAAGLKQRKENKAGESLAEALRVAARPIAGEAAQPGEETFPNKAARSQAAAAAYEKVRTEQGGTTAAQTATLQLGLLKQQTGDAAGAVPLLQDYVKSAGDKNPMRATALEALGYAHEAQGKLAEAKDAFGKMAEAGAPDRSAYQLGRIALLEKQPNARAQLQEVATKYKDEPVALEANLRLEVASLPEAKAGSAAPAKDAAPAPEKKPEPKKAEPKKPAPKKTR